MRFNEIFDNRAIKEYLKDMYEQVIYNWEEYNPSVCDPDDEEKLKQLGEDLMEKLHSAYNIVNRMSDINKDSFGF